MPKQTTTYQGGQAIQWSEDQVLEAARRVSFGVPVGFILGMAIRESGLKINEIDTDYDEDGNPREAQTYGLLQIRRSEALTALSLTAIDAEELVDPETNIKVACTVFDKYRVALDAAAQPGYAEEDMLRYLCWAHNAGIGNALPSVVRYGLDWQATLARNSPGSYAGPGGRLQRYTDTVVEKANLYTTRTTSDDGSAINSYEMGLGSDDTIFRVGLLLAVGWAGWHYFLQRSV